MPLEFAGFMYASGNGGQKREHTPATNLYACPEFLAVNPENVRNQCGIWESNIDAQRIKLMEMTTQHKTHNRTSTTHITYIKGDRGGVKHLYRITTGRT